MGSGDVITPYADLDALLGELVARWRQILGDNLAGAWVQGSFALGGGDRHSDCDWLVATHAPLTEPQIVGLRELHDEIPTRTQPWCADIEGSYAPLAELAAPTADTAIRIRLVQAVVELPGTAAQEVLDRLARDDDSDVALVAAAFVGSGGRVRPAPAPSARPA